MKKFVLIPDSFKGTMSSAEVCRIMAEQIGRFYSDAEIVSIPVADGGEGSVDAFLAAAGGEKVFCRVSGPFGEEMESFYGLLPGGTAVIEMAACAGFALSEGRRRPDLATTFGVGQLMRNAASRGCRKIIVGLGGSCTNDAGAGVAAGAGVKFFNADGKEFVPTGGTLSQVSRIDVSGLDPRLKEAEITAMCDIDNPLYGETGAAYVFAPQKGADPEMVRRLDGELRCFAETVQRELRLDIADVPGAGAAGGMGAGMAAFFGAELKMGIETVLDTVGFDRIAKDADLVFSGEGRLDSQSLRGKVVAGVAARTKKLGVRLIAVVGDIGDDIQPIYDRGVSAVFSINRVAVDFSKAKKRSRNDLALTMENLMRLFSQMQL
ncbi:glycerate kinase [Caproicibacter sp.]|uniref:glycerate kinase family protein n=1 Tax=Caproicibacter sp. TaxID=2814884 RepID=UPI003989436C